MKRILLRINARLSCILGYPIVVFLDVMIALTEHSSFKEQYQITVKALKKVWNKY